MDGNCHCLYPNPSEWIKGKVIGSGSFGIVHLAMNKATGALFVVKSAESRVGIQCLANEANILENLNSPHIVHCIGREVSNGANGERKLNLFMEYMAGGSLADVAEKFGGALDENVIRLYIREILKGLNYLHENGIVHSDLKCKNVLLGSSGSIKLADFGCAKRLSDLRINETSTQSCKYIGGTPLWMAPEVLRNEGVDFAADIWSLGCTMIEMATGKPPWSEDLSNPMAAILRIARGNEMPRFPPQFSDEGLDFLSKCLDRNPKMRWTAKELLNHPFVLGKPEDWNFRKSDAACSPASILDVGINEEDYDSDESSDGSEFINRTPLSMKSCGHRGGMSQRKRTKGQLVSSENWVTVRTG